MVKLKDLITEEKGDLLALVGKDEDEDLTTSDMQTIGRKVADMEGDELQSYLGMIKALGGYYGGRGEGKETLDDLRKAGMEAYNKAKDNETNESVNEAFGGTVLGKKGNFVIKSAGRGSGDFYYILEDTKNNRSFRLSPSEVDYVEELLKKYGHRT